MRFLGSSQTLHKRIAPSRRVLTIRPNTTRGLHKLQPNMAHRGCIQCVSQATTKQYANVQLHRGALLQYSQTSPGEYTGFNRTWHTGGAYKINLHNFLQNTHFNRNQNIYQILTTNIIEIQPRNVNFNAIFDESRFELPSTPQGTPDWQAEQQPLGKVQNSKKSENCHQQNQYEAPNIVNALVPNNTFFALPLVNKSDLLGGNSQSLTKKFESAPQLHSNG